MMRASELITEFDPSGFQQFKLYMSDGITRHLYDKFSSIDDALEELEFIWHAEPETKLIIWLITDIRDIVVWHYDPQDIADQPRWRLRKDDDTNEDYSPNEKPPGPEFRPTMPAGTVRVDVSDVYDWYKLGQHISNLKGLGKHDFGKGPPSTIFSFGDEDTEHKYIKDLKRTGLTTTDIDPPGGPRIKGQKKDPTYNVDETRIIDADTLIDIYLRGKHGGKTISKLVALNFPNQHLEALIQKLVQKYKINPSAVVYGPSKKVDENFADGKKPGRKGLAKRVGVNCKQPVSKLRSIAKNSSGEKQRMAHWCANMKSGKKKVNEIKSPSGRSKIYLDMDGVLADFFAEYARLAGLPPGSSYREIPPAKADPTLNKMVGTDFFYRLPKLPNADNIVKIATKLFGHYNICSSPLRGDHENSREQKTRWIQKYLNPQPRDIIITPRKEAYAVQPDGTPNVLIDDRKDNIIKWEAAGGIGIKYQADEDDLDVILQGLRQAVPVIKGRKEHQPQKLTPSLDRSIPVAHKS
jgi:hypothetical protein